MQLKKVLTIAGSDSCGGAGIQADLKTFHAIGVYGMSVVTALTAQNTRGIHAVLKINRNFVCAQLNAVLDDITPDAVKTGMLLDSDICRVVADALTKSEIKNIVVDPIMTSTTGDKLIKEKAVQSLIKEIIPKSLIVTPNIDEAKTLSGIIIDTQKDMKIAAERIHKLGAPIVVITGGHMQGREISDLYFDGEHFEILKSKRIDTPDTHGTGCAFSAAIAAYLALGKDPLSAVKQAREFVANALKHIIPIGTGISPVNLLWQRKNILPLRHKGTK